VKLQIVPWDYQEQQREISHYYHKIKQTVPSTCVITYLLKALCGRTEGLVVSCSEGTVVGGFEGGAVRSAKGLFVDKPADAVVGRPDVVVVGGAKGLVLGKPAGAVVGRPEGAVVRGGEGLVVGKQEGVHVGRPEAGYRGGSGRSCSGGSHGLSWATWQHGGGTPKSSQLPRVSLLDPPL